jgi:hypothetical protein
MRSRAPRNFRSLLTAAFGAALLASCVDSPPRKPPLPVGIDLQPEGPAVTAVAAVGDGARVEAGMLPGTFAVTFPIAAAKPAAVFSFAPADINDRLGIALDIVNRASAPIRVYADLNQDTWVRGYVTIAPAQAATLWVFARRKKLSAAAIAEFPGLHGIPGGKMSLWAGIEEPIVARELRVFTVMPAQETRVEVSNIRPFGSSQIPAAAGFFPFIDRYGQFKHREWPGKVHTDADLAANRQREDADLAAHPGPAGLDRFGGWAVGPQLAATGNFRTEKYRGKWWLVDPLGRLFWSDGLDCVGFGQSLTLTRGRERFYDDPAPLGNFLTRNLQTKYGTDWLAVTDDRLLRRLHSWGLNTIGGSSDRAFGQKQRVPYTLQLSSGGRASPINLDSPAWSAKLRQTLTTASAAIKDDPWCIGFFVDNEIHVSEDPAWFERYYRQVSAIAHELLPAKLYLGSRLDYHDWPDVPEFRRQIVRVAAKYCDVISFNFYKFTLEDVALPPGVDRPALVGEFHMGALDRGLFHTGLRSVVNQDQRAEAYRYYVTSALRNPAIVGAHWFQCYDESTTGRPDGEDYQIGFLDICDTPYPETIAAARDIGDQLYAIRDRSP